MKCSKRERWSLRQFPAATPSVSSYKQVLSNQKLLTKSKREILFAGLRWQIWFDRQQKKERKLQQDFSFGNHRPSKLLASTAKLPNILTTSQPNDGQIKHFKQTRKTSAAESAGLLPFTSKLEFQTPIHKVLMNRSKQNFIFLQKKLRTVHF